MEQTPLFGAQKASRSMRRAILLPFIVAILAAATGLLILSSAATRGTRHSLAATTGSNNEAPEQTFAPVRADSVSQPRAELSVPLSLGIGALLSGRSQAPFSGAVWCVDAQGRSTGGAPCTNDPAFTTIQAAINGASAGDEVRIAAGTYTGSGAAVMNIDRALTITGGYPGGVAGWNTPGGETLTVIDGQNARDGLDFTRTDVTLNVVAQNFSVLNGSMLISSRGDSTISNNLPLRTGLLNLQAGTLGGSAPITVTSVFTWGGGTQSGPGETDVLTGTTFTMNTVPQMQNGRTLNNFTSVTMTPPGLTLGGASVFNNFGTFTAVGANHNLNGGTFNNLGTFVRSDPGDSTYQSTFNNSGTVNLQSGRSFFSGGDSTGTFNVSAGATLAFCNCNAHIFEPGSVISGAGTLEASGGGNVDVISGTISVPVLNVDGSVQIDSAGGNTGTTVSVLNVSGSLSGSRTISVTNQLDWSNTMAGSGHTVVLPGAVFNIDVPCSFCVVGLNAPRVLENYSTVNWNNASNPSTGIANGGTFVNQAGASFPLPSTFSQDMHITLVNLGTITKLGGGTNVSQVTGSTTTSGLIDVQGGLLRLSANGTNTAMLGGTMRLSGGSVEFQSSSPLSMQGGTLEGSGSIGGSVNNSGGTVSPGVNGPGLLNITGDYTQGSGGSLNIELGGTQSNQYDRLAVGGTANLNGPLNTSTINGFTPQIGDSFTVLTYGSRSGTFSSILGGTFTAHYNPNDLMLVVGGPVSTATPPPSCLIQFSDVPPDSTFYPYIRCLACRGIINGYPCGGLGEPCNGNNDPYFRPGNNVTRGQFAKIASNSAGFSDPPDNQQQYEDVPVGSTFYDYIWRLTDRGLVNGYPCGGPGEPCGPYNLPYFRPNANVTRGQLSKIDANAAGFNDTPGAQQYEDVTPGSTFYDFIWRLSERSIINGYPCGGLGEPCGPNNLPYFRPGANATRGQASKIVANTFFPACQASTSTASP
jgi:hypothetical protein